MEEEGLEGMTVRKWRTNREKRKRLDKKQNVTVCRDPLTLWYTLTLSL